MPEAQNPNAQMLAAAVEKLVPLLDRIVFVGGCATGLLITDPGASPVRPTLDVDAIIDLASYAQFADLENRLQDLGFQPSHAEGAPICRWIHQDLVLDLMPTDSSILGFSNRWYHMALQNSETTRIGTHKIRLITAPYFLATKLEALHGRGQHDYRLSRDLEDIVTVINGRPDIVNEVQETEDRLRQYLSDQLSTLLADRNFMEALPGHLLPDAASQQRLRIVLHRIEQIAQKG